MSELDDRYGLNRGPYLLGRSYAATAQRAQAVRLLSQEQGLHDPALDLLTDALRAVTATSQPDLAARLRELITCATRWLDEVACICSTGTHLDYEGPAVDCPQHGRCGGCGEPLNNGQPHGLDQGYGGCA